MSEKRLLNTKNMAKIAILAVLAFILMYLEFPLPFIAPPFYKLDFSEVPVLIGGFAMGPLAAVLIEFIKILLKILFKGTTTAYVGELANFVCGCAMACPAAYVYFKNKHRKQAIKGLILGSICLVVVGFLLNVYVVIPAYINIAGYPEDAIIEMGQAIFPNIDSITKLVAYCTTPFNIIKALLLSLITILLYKRVSPLLHK